MVWYYTLGVTAFLSTNAQGLIPPFMKLGELTTNGQFSGCMKGYVSPKRKQRRWLYKKYEERASSVPLGNFGDASKDHTIRKWIKYAIWEANCLPQFMIENLHKQEANTNLDRSGQNIDWNCDDEECDIPVTLKGIWNYGCWCNFGDDLLKGKGNPVNPHDKVCMDMQLCLRCAEMDATAGGYSCKVNEGDYSSLLELGAVGLADNDESINSGCMAINGQNICGAHVCTCEVQMINDLLELLWQGYTHDPAPRHPDNPYGGGFDWESQCFIDPFGVVVKECCGKYPFRFPFNTLHKDCCETNGIYETFNPLSKVCCPDTGIQEISDGGC